ncbi:MAG TPA: hypothetical protein VFL91_06440 [Thermomicrobiales bacterium]|nr:hypothetical protein [Thermomicrobiales bacterium]
MKIHTERSRPGAPPDQVAEHRAGRECGPWCRGEEHALLIYANIGPEQPEYDAFVALVAETFGCSGGVVLGLRETSEAEPARDYYARRVWEAPEWVARLDRAYVVTVRIPA